MNFSTSKVFKTLSWFAPITVKVLRKSLFSASSIEPEYFLTSFTEKQAGETVKMPSSVKNCTFICYSANNYIVSS